MLLSRYAIFADAGYVYAAGGALVLDDSSRVNVTLKADLLLEKLRMAAEETHGAGEFLRMYWYDAAPNGIAQSDQLQVSFIPGIKLRLGRLTRNGQKGVDAMIFRDMVKLASEHAISTAFLFSGDEDLRQAVEEAQDYGVKVVIIGVTPTLDANQSDFLIREADAHEVLEYTDLVDCISSRARPLWDVAVEALPPAELQPLTDAPAEAPEHPADEPVAVPVPPQEQPAPASQPEQQPDYELEPLPLDQSATPSYLIGRALGSEMLTTQPQSELRFLRSDYPRIPREMDSEILRRLVQAAGLQPWERVDESARIEARAGFWAALGLGDRPEPPVSRDIYEVHETDPYQFGIAFAAEWMKRATFEDVEQARVLLLRNIGLPAQVDGILLRISTQHFGDPVPVQVKHELRRGFRDGLLA